MPVPTAGKDRDSSQGWQNARMVALGMPPHVPHRDADCEHLRMLTVSTCDSAGGLASAMKGQAKRAGGEMLLGAAPCQRGRELGTNTSASPAFSCPQGYSAPSPACRESRGHSWLPSFLPHSPSRRCFLGSPPDPLLAFSSCYQQQLLEEAELGLSSAQALGGGKQGPGTQWEEAGRACTCRVLGARPP